MNQTKIVTKLTAAGFAARVSGDSVSVDIYRSPIQSEYRTPCAEAVVLPLLAFCARHNLPMRRDGATCEVRI